MTNTVEGGLTSILTPRLPADDTSCITALHLSACVPLIIARRTQKVADDTDVLHYSTQSVCSMMQGARACNVVIRDANNSNRLFTSTRRRRHVRKLPKVRLSNGNAFMILF